MVIRSINIWWPVWMASPASASSRNAVDTAAWSRIET
jgi:hypothetical protein